VLVEAAWHYRHHPFIGKHLRRRHVDAPDGRSNTRGARNSDSIVGINGSPLEASPSSMSSPPAPDEPRSCGTQPANIRLIHCRWRSADQLTGVHHRARPDGL